MKEMVRENRMLNFKYDHNDMRIQKMPQHDTVLPVMKKIFIRLPRKWYDRQKAAYRLYD